MMTDRLGHAARALLPLAVVGSLSAACGGDPAKPPTGIATDSVCPTTQTLTYANFGQQFFESYCQSCHASTVTGAARNGAPADHVFDQVQDIQLLREHIDEYAAAGPAGVNTIMPPEAPRPTEAERRQLGEWLACEAP